MVILIKTPEQIAIMREGGKILAKILKKVAKKVAPGISTYDIDKYTYDLIKENGAEHALLKYKPEGSRIPYPATICISVNEEIVHGIPNKKKIIKIGDIVSLDLVIKYKGYFTGIEAAIGGATVGDIGYAIESFVNRKYGIVRELAGHGVGIKIHEDPYVPNYGKAGKGQKLIPGMVIAIEPMLNNGRAGIISLSDGYTIITADNSRSAHFEHTILITEGEAEILTKI